jgi:hypothetical protein
VIPEFNRGAVLKHPHRTGKPASAARQRGSDKVSGTDAVATSPMIGLDGGLDGEADHDGAAWGGRLSGWAEHVGDRILAVAGAAALAGVADDGVLYVLPNFRLAELIMQAMPPRMRQPFVGERREDICQTHG